MEKKTPKRFWAVFRFDHAGSITRFSAWDARSAKDHRGLMDQGDVQVEYIDAAKVKRLCDAIDAWNKDSSYDNAVAMIRARWVIFR